MEMRKLLILSILIISTEGLWQYDNVNPYPAFDPNFYKSVLDFDECQKQIRYMADDALPKFMLADASARFPKGILEGNIVDLGNYHECLSINYDVDDMVINGKYCLILFDALDIIKLALGQENKGNNTQLQHHPFQSAGYAYIIRTLMETLKKKEREYGREMDYLDKLSKENVTNLIDDMPEGLKIVITLGMCIPKPCSSQQVFKSVLFDDQGMKSMKDLWFTEDYCRLPDDKPWSPADTVATVIFTSIGILTLICTAYDVVHKLILKSELKYCYIKIFSAYTNGCRLVTFPSNAFTLQCLDGIRVLSTIWVILGHSAMTLDRYHNIVGMWTWIESINSFYIFSAPLSVDSFFVMSGLLLVYTICAKVVNSRQFIKNIPMFYLSRYLRLLPLLATTVLLQVSFIHRMSDGPLWTSVSRATDACRKTWWITLLTLINYFSGEKCVSYSWYVAIDFHLYLISPLVLLWIFGSKKRAWISLIASLLISLVSAGIYNFAHDFLVTLTLLPRSVNKINDFDIHYYHNTLTRASPFFVGMVFGYLLHTCREKRVHLAWHSVVLLWTFTLFLFTSSIFVMHFVRTEDWDHQILDNLLNTFLRPAWALGIGCMVFACKHGYGGPVNWFLSLKMWRLPARLCYGAYLLHGPVLQVFGDSTTTLDYYSPGKFVFIFLAFVPIAFLLSYVATVVIDIPFAVICKQLLGKRKMKESTKL